MFDDIQWETVKEMRPCLKNDILRSFTPRSAIDYLPADLDRKPNDESDLLQQRNEKEGGHMLNCTHLLDSMIYYLTDGVIYYAKRKNEQTGHARI